MKPWTVLTGISVLLVACNGGDDSSQGTQADATAADATTAAQTADSVRATILALRRGGTDGAAPPFTLPPSNARDPGPRPLVNGTSSEAGGAVELSAKQMMAFEAGKAEFDEADDVEEGLGPTMNLDSCGGCHSHPAIGGTSPPKNPQIGFATAGGSDTVPSFLSETGPIREVRFVRNPDGSPDGGVHGLFTITGREGADGCNLKQPDFETELRRNNLVFRIPTPLFGAGLIESIPDREIVQNQARSAQAKQAPEFAADRICC